MFAFGGCVSLELVYVLTHFAQKVFVLISWVVQGDRMLLQFHSLLYLPIALCIKKHEVVHLSIFEKSKPIKSSSFPCHSFRSIVWIFFLFEVSIILPQTYLQHSYADLMSLWTETIWWSSGAPVWFSGKALDLCYGSALFSCSLNLP